jgi:hypothetical protein
LIALSPHPSGSTSEGSITTTYNVLYPTCYSSILDILGIVYCTIFGVWNCATSFANCTSSTTFSFSFRYMTTWYNYLYKLRVTTWFIFVAILPLFLGIFLGINFNPYNYCLLKFNSGNNCSPILNL